MDAVFMSFTLELLNTGGRIVLVGMSKEGEH